VGFFSGKQIISYLTSRSFSSEAGVALNFFAYFLVSRPKSMWGLGQCPGNNKLFKDKKSRFQEGYNIYSHIPAGSQVFPETRLAVLNRLADVPLCRVTPWFAGVD